jgi:hypothetical protein
MLRFIPLLFGAVSVLAGACGNETSDSDASGASAGTGGIDDGKVHPPPNGVQITEDEACAMLQGAYQQRAFTLQCSSKTVRTCPGFVRVQYDPDCVLFDQGSVQGCVDHINDIFNCDLLIEDGCLATVYPGTEPAGCAVP